ncbi:hypothetical protein GCM10008983_18700 [Lentibacillus halophilus]|uniref:YtpI-like protein n=1 Tax=Lentibacillus halophilus TaxID=295065 RepID=A0ABP3J4L4_9BACI
MSLTYGLWIGLCCIGIIAGIYLIVKDKSSGTTKPKEKRELQASIFFTFVMFCMSVVSFFEIGISPMLFLFAFSFLMGSFMVIHSFKKRKNEAYKTKILTQSGAILE